MDRSKKDVFPEISVSTLKARLAEFIREVKKGNEIVITEYKKPVARIIPEGNSNNLETLKAQKSFSELSKIKIPKKKKKIKQDSLSLLLAERGNR
ncbi:type II toxin-antitoxin system Phd/YefM family antitoxin [Candidatus Riflebacteria bacterium]